MSIYDLKGSSVNREVKNKMKPTSILKDVNFTVECNRDPYYVQLMNRNRLSLRRAIRKDVEFLRSNGLMDYSLLLAIEEADDDLKDFDTLHFQDAPRYS